MYISRYVITFLLSLSILHAVAREPHFKTPYLASLKALSDLKLDSIQQCADSIAVRLMSVDSATGRIVIYDLRTSPEKTISLIYWAESSAHTRQRCFGLIRDKVWYSPVYQVGMLYPYQKVSDIVSNVPRCATMNTHPSAPACSSVFFKFANDYATSYCCSGDCQCVDAVQAFFDKYFYYQKD